MHLGKENTDERFGRRVYVSKSWFLLGHYAVFSSAD